MTPHLHSRRQALGLGAAALGVTFLGSPALAAGDLSRRKLVVLVCRGAMDGLSVTVPYGDPNYMPLRGAIAIPADQVLKLDGDFGLHPKLVTLKALHDAGQMRVAPAVALPQRIRSHFEAQDLLESGGEQLYGTATGWLNRTLTAIAPARRVQALSVGPQDPLILKGPFQTQSWSPGGKLTPNLARISTTLQDLYKTDPVLGPALASGLETETQAESLDGGMSGGGGRGGDVRGFASTAAKFLTTPGGPSIAVISLNGFDTHAGQGAAEGQLAQRLKSLDDVVAGLRDGMGAAWGDTVVIAVTEFGRTAHVNGTGGTDHGTASTLILAGGALKRGGMVGDWPTLAPAKLFENRDLAPTLDVRQVFKGVLADHLGVDRRALETAVFPSSGEAPALNGLIA